MLRIAIVEDEDGFAKELEGYLERFGRENDETILTFRFRDGGEIAACDTQEFDIILMDIQMEQMDGMTAAEKIRERDGAVIIIFITNRADFAIRGYQVDALDYVLKPVNYLSLARTIGRAVQRRENRQGRKISLNTRRGLLTIDVNRIRYIESQGHNITYYTEIGEYTVRDRMQDIEENMRQYGFYRINKGCLVNLRCVDGVSNGCVIAGESVLPVSRGRRQDFMNTLTRYMGEN